MRNFEVKAIGTVESSLTDLESAPRQADHRVEITATEGRRVRVRHLEVLNGTPIIDVKPILSGDISQR